MSSIAYGDDLAGLIAYYGADTGTDAIGEAEIIAKNTARWTAVRYFVAQWNPPQVKAIVVMKGTWMFTGPDTAVQNYDAYIYPASADADHDGYPRRERHARYDTAWLHGYCQARVGTVA